MKIALEYDDFSCRNSNLGLLEDLKDHYKNFKVTLFTVPWEVRWGEQTPITLPKFKPFCDAVRRASDWIEIAVHGLTHGPSVIKNEFGQIVKIYKEFESLSYEEAKKRAIVAEKMLINQKITFAKIFKAPHWLLSLGGEKALLELGYQVVKDHYYQWNLKDDLPKLPEDTIIIAHGHIQNVMGNGLEETFSKIMELPPDTKFYWLSEVLKADKIDSAKMLEVVPNINQIPGDQNVN